jgi:Bacterial regulatory proteins, gntR family
VTLPRADYAANVDCLVRSGDRLTGGEMAEPSEQLREMVLTDCRLDRQSFTPLYQQIKDLVVSRIRRGEFSVGDVLPSEVKLAAAFRVSRLTVRQALYELRVEGYIIREKGRGTFVSSFAARVRST